MNANQPFLQNSRCRTAIRAVVFLAIAFLSVSAIVARENYLRVRTFVINHDVAAIVNHFGGAAEEDQIVRVEFLKEWEYKALKRTPDGEGVWLHVKLSKRPCGNWMFVDPAQRDLIRPYHVRHPNGNSR